VDALCAAGIEAWSMVDMSSALACMAAGSMPGIDA
jgi:hypothetical protein